jgi:hypothetical protein
MAELQAHGEQGADNTAAEANPVFSDIRTEGYWVIPAVQEILDEQPQLSFTTNDICIACKEGSAALWVAKEGFVISTGETDTFTGDRTFLVWVAWARDRRQSCVIKYYEFFADVARESGFKHIEVRTPIRKLEPYLIAEGWDIDTVVYTREL